MSLARRRPPSYEDAATGFMLHAVQEWGDPDEKRIAAVQEVLDAAGFKATATCWPVFGGIWPKPCEGKDATAATEWLKSLTDDLPRGDVHTEIAFVKQRIEERRGAGG